MGLQPLVSRLGELVQVGAQPPQLGVVIGQRPAELAPEALLGLEALGGGLAQPHRERLIAAVGIDLALERGRKAQGMDGGFGQGAVSVRGRGGWSQGGGVGQRRKGV